MLIVSESKSSYLMYLNMDLTAEQEFENFGLHF